jgi:hypothetical protein
LDERWPIGRLGHHYEIWPDLVAAGSFAADFDQFLEIDRYLQIIQESALCIIVAIAITIAIANP